jgi:hypothetical protein
MSSPSMKQPSRAEATRMNSQDQQVDGPTGKPSQAEGEDPDRPEEHEVLPAEGHPSQAEGEDPDDDEAAGSS